ncbi:ATP-binding protein [Nocardia barduliensis]|uniref:ATP-binding protein n=1 Tax=Nocardia barduliensis TaxID=2736643 RepID=UPI001571FE7B|nr:AAA family ATPase [Nocardia barduliensis]
MQSGGSGRGASEFVGRDAELRRIETMVRNGVRMITLTGPGGVGKTSLAERALSEFSRSSDHRVFWTRLADLARDCDLEAVAAQVLASAEGASCSGRSPVAELADTLAPARGGAAVLVLDSCEHVLAGVAGLVAKLLEVVPALTILATSRENVGWVDEHLVTVPPLSTTHAVEVFRRRADRIGRPLRGDPEELAIAARICRAVENNPLFVRLAAARLRHRPLTGVLRELTGDDDDMRLRWSRGVVVGTDSRHLGVREAIAWSYELCDTSERALLERMSVFAPGSDDAAAAAGEMRDGVESADVTAVCSGDGVLAPHQVPRLLERLADKSLVGMRMTATTVRYHLVGSVRLFAWERLCAADPDRAAGLRRRHRRYFRDGLRAVRETGTGPHGRDGMGWVRGAMGDIAGSVETSLSDAAEAMVGLEIASTLLSVLSSAERTPAGDELVSAWAESTSALASGDYDVAREALRRLSPDSGHADSEYAVPASSSVARSRWSELTPAESEVALLAAAGWANREIAVRRGASVRTVDAQLAAVRHKLMVASRTEIVRYVPLEVAQRVRRESTARRRA